MQKLTKKEAINFLNIPEKDFDNYFKREALKIRASEN